MFTPLNSTPCSVIAGPFSSIHCKLTSCLKHKTRNSNSQQSAIKSHLCVSDSCRELYRDDVFSVFGPWQICITCVCFGTALYIHKLSPELCVQKENVLSLQLFGANPRQSVSNASPH